MLKLISVFATLALSASFAFAAPPCNSGSCVTNGSGHQCAINGQTHTCGACGDTNVLYVGDLTGAEADKKCKTQHMRGAKAAAQKAPAAVAPVRR